jgi:DNA-binding NarL/FixJ family response regulator
MACLAYAIGIEDPGARAGWYGGLGPEDRSALALALEVEAEPAAPHVSHDAALEAIRLRETGLTVNEIAARMTCSRRTVQRYCRKMQHANDI